MFNLCVSPKIPYTNFSNGNTPIVTCSLRKSTCSWVNYNKFATKYVIRVTIDDESLDIDKSNINTKFKKKVLIL